MSRSAQTPVFSMLAAFTFAAGVHAQSPTNEAPPEPWSLHAQITAISQGHGGFPAEYSGTNSLSPEREVKSSLTATVFLGARLWRGGELYVVPEVAGGRGLSGVVGVAGFPNGDITRVATPDLRLYVSRAFVRQSWRLGSRSATADSAPLQLAGVVPESRLALTAGKLAATDIFDTNAFSHDPRTQFLNWSLMDQASWDYPADTRGYTWGFALELVRPVWALRVGSFLVPTTANGMSFDTRVRSHHGEVVELELHANALPRPGTVRLLAYQNHANMGTYRDALALAGGAAPDVTTTRRRGTRKYGFGVNLEQPITENVGAFARWGWNDGRTETWAFTEVDRTVAVGVQLLGRAWNRGGDAAGVALAVNDVAPDHRDYLAAGGVGFIVGDGALRHGAEHLLEAFYHARVVAGAYLAADCQYVRHPAFNRARGPVVIWTLRLHWEM